MDSDQGKLFIGGIPWDTSEDKLKDYFGKYGEVSEIVIMRDKISGRSRGFGFIVFSDPSVLDTVLQDKHIIDGRTVEPKRALSKEEQHTTPRSGNPNSERGGTPYIKTKKIFVGGLPSTLTEESFRQYFETYGQVTDVVVMYDQNTQRPRGFGFISFDTEEAVDKVLHRNFHEVGGKLVEVKRALPKDINASSGGGRGGGGWGYLSNFDYRQEGNRFLQQPQVSPSGFSPYSGYGAVSYGYGIPNGGIAYGAYGGYALGGYGGSGYGCSPGYGATTTGQSITGVPRNQGYVYGSFGGYGGYGLSGDGAEQQGTGGMYIGNGYAHGGAQYRQAQ